MSEHRRWALYKCLKLCTFLPLVSAYALKRHYFSRLLGDYGATGELFASFARYVCNERLHILSSKSLNRIPLNFVWAFYINSLLVWWLA
jgi:hypothetical protein